MFSQMRFRLLHRSFLAGNRTESLPRSTIRAWLSSKNDGNDENDASKTFPADDVSQPMRSFIKPAPPSAVRKLREEMRMKSGREDKITRKKETEFVATDSIIDDLFNPNVTFKSSRKVKEELRRNQPKKKPEKMKSYELGEEMLQAVMKVADLVPKQKAEVQQDLIEKTTDLIKLPNLEKGRRKKTKKDQSKKSDADQGDTYALDDSLNKIFSEPLFKGRKMVEESTNQLDEKKKKRKEGLPNQTTDQADQNLIDLVSKTFEDTTAFRRPGVSFDKAEDLGIFPPNMEASPGLKIWNALEMAHLKRSTRFEPINWFDQCIQWTEDGKLWHFPIDNEQGMDEESQVDFTEHIFLDHHIESWCPQEGPIRIFMELILVGLSKNPYYTVKEKKETLEWYRQYFAKHQGLLEEIGALGSVQNPIEVEAKLD